MHATRTSLDSSSFAVEAFDRIEDKQRVAQKTHCAVAQLFRPKPVAQSGPVRVLDFEQNFWLMRGAQRSTLDLRHASTDTATRKTPSPHT